MIAFVIVMVGVVSFFAGYAVGATERKSGSAVVDFLDKELHRNRRP